MESVANWYSTTLSGWLPKEVFIFLVSMVPLIELRGGIAIAKLLQIPLLKANIICIIGNIIPIPFILLFIRRIFIFMKDHNILKGLVEKLEARAAKKSTGAEKGQFIFLLLFVGIPLPGTGAWTGSLIAALFEFERKRTYLAIFLGILMAALLIDIIFYGVLGIFLH
jgi:Predicted membrane protein